MTLWICVVSPEVHSIQLKKMLMRVDGEASSFNWQLGTFTSQRVEEILFDKEDTTSSEQRW